MFLYTLVALLLCARPAFSAFNTTVTWAGDVIRQNAQGTWCYYPNSRPVGGLTCSGGQGLEPQYSGVLTAHLAATVSIGYYDQGYTRLGGAEWPIPPGIGSVFLCASGRRPEGGAYLSFCERVSQDNEFQTPSWCEVALGQAVVTDGCYAGSGGPSGASAPSASPTAQSSAG